jgi:hypothetical protein
MHELNSPTWRQSGATSLPPDRLSSVHRWVLRQWLGTPFLQEAHCFLSSITGVSFPV